MYESFNVALSYTKLLQIVEGLRRGFNTRKTYDKKYRRTQLKQIELFMEEHKEGIMAALKQDLSKVTIVSISLCFLV